MTEAQVGRQYNRWLRSGSVSSRGYAFLASLPGMMLINTPVYRFDKNLALKPEQRLLDIGCGPGSLLRILASRVHFHSPPAGLDLSAEMLRRARLEPRERPLDFVQAAATALPFAEGAFDVVTCGYVLKHLDDRSLDFFLVEVLRVLKPGGFAVLWEFRPTRSIGLDRLNRWVVTRGVKAAHFRPYGAIGAAATRAGFDWVDNAHLRPFLFPPIPRVSLVLGKAPEGWREDTGPGRARRAAIEGRNGRS